MRIYLWTRLPIVPIYGGFPVKLRTHIGKPIPYDPDLSAEDLQKKVIYYLKYYMKKKLFVLLLLSSHIK